MQVVEEFWTWKGIIMTVEQAKTLKVDDYVLVWGELCKVYKLGNDVMVVLTPRDTTQFSVILSAEIPTALLMALI